MSRKGERARSSAGDKGRTREQRRLSALLQGGVREGSHAAARWALRSCVCACACMCAPALCVCMCVHVPACVHVHMWVEAPN